MTRLSDKSKSAKRQSAEAKTYEYVPAPNPKDIAAEELQKIGFVSKNEGGVLMIYYKVTEKYTEVLKQVQTAIKALGYESSYGITPLKETNNIW